MRCSGQTSDIVLLSLDFPTTYQESFHLESNYTDYDGSANQTKFDFAYDNTTNTLSCLYSTTDASIPGFLRKDKFTVELKEDDTDYLGAENVSFQNGGGCNEEIRLVNKEH